MEVFNRHSALLIADFGIYFSNSRTTYINWGNQKKNKWKMASSPPLSIFRADPFVARACPKIPEGVKTSAEYSVLSHFSWCNFNTVNSDYQIFFCRKIRFKNPIFLPQSLKGYSRQVGLGGQRIWAHKNDRLEDGCSIYNPTGLERPGTFGFLGFLFIHKGEQNQTHNEEDHQ